MNERNFPAKKREWVFDAINLIKRYSSVRKKAKTLSKRQSLGQRTLEKKSKNIVLSDTKSKSGRLAAIWQKSSILRHTRQNNSNNNPILLEKNKAKHVFGAIKLKKAQFSYKKAKTFFLKN